jgi:hypothetical protein
MSMIAHNKGSTASIAAETQHYSFLQAQNIEGTEAHLPATSRQLQNDAHWACKTEFLQEGPLSRHVHHKLSIGL